MTIYGAYDCHVCGEPFDVDEHGVTFHLSETSPTGVDHEADEDHVPYSLHIAAP